MGSWRIFYGKMRKVGKKLMIRVLLEVQQRPSIEWPEGAKKGRTSPDDVA
jgi:hypothetical protein